MQIYRQRRRYMRKKWPARIARSTTLLQWNSSFGEMQDQVHFSCGRLCWKVSKYDINILSLSVSLYERFERPTYLPVDLQISVTHVLCICQCWVREWCSQSQCCGPCVNDSWNYAGNRISGLGTSVSHGQLGCLSLHCSAVCGISVTLCNKEGDNTLRCYQLGPYVQKNWL